jgi:hypothetical protein
VKNRAEQPRNFQQLAERWMKAEGPTKKKSTLDAYRNCLRRYVVPAFGQRPIAAIGREEIQRFFAEQSQQIQPRHSSGNARHSKPDAGMGHSSAAGPKPIPARASSSLSVPAGERSSGYSSLRSKSAKERSVSMSRIQLWFFWWQQLACE